MSAFEHCVMFVAMLLATLLFVQVVGPVIYLALGGVWLFLQLVLERFFT